jgi:hypothetical protein
MNVQDSLAEIAKPAGGLKFNAARAFSNQVRRQDAPKRFVDGAFLELFLDLSAKEQHACVEGLVWEGRQVAVKEVCDVIDALKRLC